MHVCFVSNDNFTLILVNSTGNSAAEFLREREDEWYYVVIVVGQWVPLSA